MRQREGGHAVADPRFGLVGELLPAVADIDAEALQAKEHGRRVLHIDVDVRRRDGERRGEIAEAGVVELEHRGMIAVLQLEQRAVPPEMVLQVVSALPVGRERGEPLNAFAAAPLRLQHVGDGVRRPEIAGVELDGMASVGLCREIVPGFLVRERAAGEYRRKAGSALRPGRNHALDGVDHVVRAAEPEIDEMRETKCDRVVRVAAQDRFPHGDGTIELAVGPRSQRSDVVALSLRRAGGKRHARCAPPGPRPERRPA